jgi:serine/threonine protein kinase
MKPELSTLSFPPGILIKEETKQFIENLLEGDPKMRMDMDEVLSHPFLRDEKSKKPMRLE